MKQCTDKQQTAKLIELGFEKPFFLRRAYLIGELIEMLNGVSELEITRYGSGWGIYDELRAFTGEELIDNLFDMILKLKEEGVI